MQYMRKCLLTAITAIVIGNTCLAQETTTPEASVYTLPTWGIKTNLLYDATTTINLGMEFKTGRKTSFEISGNYNPWTFDNNRKWKHLLIQPEFRFWPGETFRRSFFGLHAHYGYYNIGGLDNPPFSEYMNAHRFEGWLAGAGIGYGYRWNFNHRLAMEAEIGVGYAYLSYDKYPCTHCGEKIGSEVKNYIGPTKAAISLIYSFGAKKKPVQNPEPVYIPPVVVKEPEPAKPVVAYVPQFAVSFITPEVETVKQRSEAGKAYLDFVVGRSEIVPSFKNNAVELDKIHALIRQVQNDPDATITGITITGYASPEGTYESNMTLSQHRANALKEHIRSMYGFSHGLFRVEGRGEDWKTLDVLVEQSGMADKYRILEIIRGTDIFDGREKKLMDLSGGNPYRQMKVELFPQLRRSDYELHYTVLPFTVEKGKAVFKTKPSSLSLNEMFLIADTYEPGSTAFNEVFETAARIFPASDVANINAAANALNRKDAVSAAQYLQKVKGHTPAYWNNAGILAYMQGDKQKAAECFAKAAGNAEAIRNTGELVKCFKTRESDNQ